MSIGWVDLDGVVNMRDVGGLPTADGRSVRTGRLLRSDNLQDLTERDIRRLIDDYGVTDIVDLRSNVEYHAEGPGPLSATPLTHHRHSLFRDDEVAVRVRALREDGTTVVEGVIRLHISDRPDRPHRPDGPQPPKGT